MPQDSPSPPFRPAARSRSALARRADGIPTAACAPSASIHGRAFRARALARGISESTYIRCLSRIEPDMSVFEKLRKQPEFSEQLWQYINRRVSDWRLAAGKAALQKHHALFARIEKDFGVERGTLLALWGVESAYGDPLVQQNHMRPVFPSLAALAWNEPRRRSYWETELLNALRIVDKGWSTPEEMRGSWAGAMGTPMDAGGLAQCRSITTATAASRRSAGPRRARLQRALSRQGGKYRRGEHWGYEVRGAAAAKGGNQSYARWAAAGVTRADASRSAPERHGAMWVPGGRAGVPARPELLRGAQYQPVDELRARHRPSRRPHLGGGPFVQRSRSERALTLARPGVQTRLTKAASTPRHRRPRRQRHHEGGPGLPDQGRPLARDGYAGLKVLARLRQGCKPV